MSPVRAAGPVGVAGRRLGRSEPRRRTWHAPAWLCPDLRGLADPGQRPDGQGRVELHREQYVSHDDALRMRRYLNPIPATRGWTRAHQEENHPGDILAPVGPSRLQRDRHPGGRPGGVEWPDGVVGLLLTPLTMRLDRGQLDHPKKRLRERPTEILTLSRGWRGVVGQDTGLVLLVRHEPQGRGDARGPGPMRGPGLALHRIARTVRRDGGSSEAHLLLREDGEGDGASPTEDDLDRYSFLARERFTSLVDLTHHASGPAIVTSGRRALPQPLATQVGRRFPDVLQLSVREDLLDDLADVDRIAAEVSAMLLEPAHTTHGKEG